MPLNKLKDVLANKVKNNWRCRYEFIGWPDNDEDALCLCCEEAG